MVILHHCRHYTDEETEAQASCPKFLQNDSE